MTGPEPDGRHVEISMLARAEPPGARHANSDAKRVARKNLYLGLGASFSDISHDEANEAEKTL
jgi:hypothetical protein